MKKKALITGIAGFAGSHLAEYLLKKNISVFGFFHPAHSTQNIDHLRKKIKLIACDIQVKFDVEGYIKSIKPDYVFHLAAFSSPAESFKFPLQTLENNVVSQLNILEALVNLKSAAKILVVGSADEYGNIEKKYLPASEETPLSPISPYAVSKIAQDMLGLQFFTSHRLNIVRVRPFNHIGPRQSTAFVVSSFAAQIANIEKVGGGTIKVGNLASFRDFTDVRDMVRAYLAALDRGIYGEVYNIGSGDPLKIADILKLLLSFSKLKIKVSLDKSRIHPVEIDKIYCDFSKFYKQTGWQPEIPLVKTLSDTIEYERHKLN